MRIKNKYLVLLSIFAVLFFVSSSVYALELKYPRVPGAIPPQDFIKTVSTDEIPSYFIKYIFNLVIWASGIIFLGALIFAGVQFLTSSGKPEKIIATREQIAAAFFGLLILFCSFFVLKILNPKIVVSETPKITPIKVVKISEISLPPTSQKYRSLINTEIPIGTIIESGIFETKVPRDEQGKRKSRMDRIKDIASNFLALAGKLGNQSSALKNASSSCACGSSYPCCYNSNPGPGCKNNSCSSKEGCTGDPCIKVRSQIQSLEQKNIEVIYKGTDINENAAGHFITIKIKTSIIKEQKKAEEEIRLIREEIGKLEAAEKLIIECGSMPLDSLAQFFFTKNFYSASQWFLLITKVWKNLDILEKNDWLTFYCTISGSIEAEAPNLSAEDIEKSIPPMEDTQAPSGEELLSCPGELRIGEIIDRAERLGYKLVERLEKLVNLEQQLINAVDQLGVLISQCSSQGASEGREGCRSICFCSGFECEHCIKSCQGSPCPSAAINAQFQKINDIINGKGEIEGIKQVISGEETGKEKIGILTIIDKVLPEFFSDLSKIKQQIKNCVTEVKPDEIKEEPNESEVSLSDCESSIRARGGTAIIEKCCYDQQPFKDCLQECYLTTEPAMPEPDSPNNAYEYCLKTCLDRKSKELNYRELSTCHHTLNFFCCGK